MIRGKMKGQKQAKMIEKMRKKFRRELKGKFLSMS